MKNGLRVTMIVSTCFALLASSPTRAEDRLVLQNERLGLTFDRQTGTLTALENKLAEETYKISGDEFAVEAEAFRLDFPDAALASLEIEGEAVRAR